MNKKVKTKTKVMETDTIAVFGFSFVVMFFLFGVLMYQINKLENQIKQQSENLETFQVLNLRLKNSTIDYLNKAPRMERDCKILSNMLFKDSNSKVIVDVHIPDNIYKDGFNFSPHCHITTGNDTIVGTPDEIIYEYSNRLAQPFVKELEKTLNEL